jgi:hypothetical protein
MSFGISIQICERPMMRALTIRTIGPSDPSARALSLGARLTLSPSVAMIEMRGGAVW